jgi:hypothetical protein
MTLLNSIATEIYGDIEPAECEIHTISNRKNEQFFVGICKTPLGSE